MKSKLQEIATEYLEPYLFENLEIEISQNSQVSDMRLFDAYRSRFKDFITGRIATYLRVIEKQKWWRGNIELVAFSELFEFNISVYNLIIDLIPRYSYEYSRSSKTISLIYRKEQQYNLLMRKVRIK